LVSFSEPDSVTFYKIYESTDGVVFDSIMVHDTANVISGLSPNMVYFFKVKAVNEGGESGFSEVLGARTSTSPVHILVVNGYDAKKTGNTYNFIIQHGFAISNSNYAFNSCADECIQRGVINPGDYEAIDWILGQEDTREGTFNAAEQNSIENYLQEGGKLFVSGSDIGYALHSSTFYSNYLRANYMTDNVGAYSVNGLDGSIFSGIEGIHFDDGNHGIYKVKYPDGIDTTLGSIRCLQYTGKDYYGGIQYSGVFGSGTTPGKLVYLSFPFETVYPESLRNVVMNKVIEFFGVPGIEEEKETEISLFQNYPNPFNQVSGVRFQVSGTHASRFTPYALRIYDLSGRPIKTLDMETERQGEGENVTLSTTWDGKDEAGKRVPAGIYFCRLRIGENHFCRKLVFLGG
jgi:hypothetical protein